MRKDTKHNLLPATLLMVLLFAVSGTALGQSTATLQGTISDIKGAVIPNASVTARNQGTAVERVTQTDSAGSYQLAALPAGVWASAVPATIKARPNTSMCANPAR